MFNKIKQWFQKAPAPNVELNNYIEYSKALEQDNLSLRILLISIGLQNNGNLLIKPHFINAAENNNLDFSLSEDEENNLYLSVVEIDAQ